MEIGRLVREYRQSRGLSLREFAAKAGISHAYLDTLEKGLHPRTGKVVRPTLDVVRMLAAAMEMDVQKLIAASDAVAPPPDVSPREIVSGPTRRIPVLGVIRAGEPILAEEHIEGWEDIPVQHLNGGEYFYLRVSGSSMEPTIRPGYLVLVKCQPTAEDGDIVVAIVNDDHEATLKKFFRREDTVYLQAENPAFQPIIIPASEVRIIRGRRVALSYERF